MGYYDLDKPVFFKSAAQLSNERNSSSKRQIADNCAVASNVLHRARFSARVSPEFDGRRRRKGLRTAVTPEGRRTLQRRRRGRVLRPTAPTAAEHVAVLALETGPSASVNSSLG